MPFRLNNDGSIGRLTGAFNSPLNPIDGSREKGYPEFATSFDPRMVRTYHHRMMYYSCLMPVVGNVLIPIWPRDTQAGVFTAWQCPDQIANDVGFFLWMSLFHRVNTDEFKIAGPPYSQSCFVINGDRYIEPAYNYSPIASNNAWWTYRNDFDIFAFGPDFRLAFLPGHTGGGRATAHYCRYSFSYIPQAYVKGRS